MLLCLPVALRCGSDIVSDIPVSNLLLHNLNEVLIPTLVNTDAALKPIKVKAPGSDLVFNGTGVGTGLSCGVDSLYTAMEYMSGKIGVPKLTHFFVASASLDLWDTPDLNLFQWQEKHKNFFLRSDAAAAELGLPLIKMYSNYYDYACTKVHTLAHITAHHYITMANVLALKKLWSIYLYSSTFPYTEFDLKNNSQKDAAYYELLIMHSLTIPGFLLLSAGAKVDRLQKTLALADYPLAKKYLHPCFTPEMKNCSNPNCHKCLRALLTLNYYNKLEEFGNVFDVKRFYNNFNEYIVQLISNRHNKYLSRLYTMYKDSYPEIFNTAFQEYGARVEYWEHVKEFAYALSIKYLNLENLDALIKQFIHQNKIKEVFFVGNSRLGNTIKGILKKYVKLNPYSPGAKGDMLVLLDTEEPKITSHLGNPALSDFRTVYTLEKLHEKLMEYKNNAQA